jgi:hypothetical protein
VTAYSTQGKTADSNPLQSHIVYAILPAIRSKGDAMAKIIKYRLETGSYIDLYKRVNDLIIEGWQPFGAPIYTGAGFAQAMVEYEEEKAAEA